MTVAAAAAAAAAELGSWRSDWDDLVEIELSAVARRGCLMSAETALLKTWLAAAESSGRTDCSSRSVTA